MDTDPRRLIADSPMSLLQGVVVALTLCLNALDGFDVMSISYASPGIATEWGIDRAALGIVLSMELVGMAVGSILLGRLADVLGRRPVMLGCLVVMAAGMYMAPTATGMAGLSAWRVFTGLGIGGVLAATNAVAAEFSSAKYRNLSVSLMAMGYPLGAIFGGMVAVRILGEGGDWHGIFHFGAVATALFVPLTWLLMPESVSWLVARQPRGALKKVNATLRRMGHAAIDILPACDVGVPGRKRDGSLFSPRMLRTTLLMAAAYFGHITTFYYLLKWTPRIVVDMGFSASAAAGVLVWANVGGAVGGGVVGLLATRLNLRGVLSVMLAGSALLITFLGRGYQDLAALSLVCAVAGFFTNGAINGLYATFAQVFPSSLRASGTGFSIGVGRGGSVLAPILAGFLFQAGVALPVVSALLATGSLLGLLCLWLVPMPDRAGARHRG